MTHNPTPQTQIVLRDVQLWCNALKRHKGYPLGRKMHRDLAGFMASTDDWPRQWYFQEYCFAVHYLCEEDVSLQAVSQLLDAVDWSVVSAELTAAFQEARVLEVVV